MQNKGTIGYNKKSALLEDAITQMNAGKYGRASSALKDLLALDPLNAEARRLFATLHLRLGSLMSARTAFESLAREALERQDYWLAESLLREYLTAGPRCVPFLEMLGHLYEGKGDVMAAVAEYGKAVEVLLEDPDTDLPNRASELFGKIRTLAPGSPVAFRLAAMFDTVTGQMVQAAPQPTVDSTTEPPHSSAVVEAPTDAAPALAMPWEQMDPLPADPAISRMAEIPTIEESIGTIPSVPCTLADSPAESMPSALASDSEPATQVAGQETSPAVPMPPESSLSSLSQTARHQGAPQDETRTHDSSLSVPTFVEDSKSGLELLVEGSSQPIIDKPLGLDPMPVGQVEEVPLAIAGDPASELPHSADTHSMPAVEDDATASLLAQAPQSSVDAPVEESGKESTGEALANSASMQGADAVDRGNMAEIDSARTEASEVEIVASIWGQPDPLPPISESMSSTIEVLKTSSAYPIAETPLSPTAMPWDQIEEMPEVLSPSAGPEPVVEKKAEEVPTSSAAGPFVDAAAVPDSPAAPGASFTSSLGLSWEDILAAVAAMQASPPYPASSDSTAQNGPVTESVLPEESTAPQVEGSEVDWPSHPTPMSDSFGIILNDSGPTLSAPMPWEQIEVEDVAILRPDPEPEFGLTSADAVNGVQDSTPVLPPTEEMHESGPALSPDFRILSPDMTVELPTESLSIDIPSEAVKPLEPVESIEGAEDPGEMAPSRGVTTDIDAEHPLQDAMSEGIAPLEAEAPEVMFAEPFAEPSRTASAETPLISPHVSEETEVLREQIELPPLTPPSEDDRPLTLVAQIEAIHSATWETKTQPEVPSEEGSLVADQVGFQNEPPLEGTEIMSTVGDAEPRPEPKSASPEAVSSPAARSLSNVSSEQIPNEPVWTPPDNVEPASTVAPFGHCSDGTDQPTAGASVPATNESVSTEPRGTDQEAATTVSEAPREDGIRILWNDSFSKRASSVSAGNMLTRWLKRTPDVASVDVDQPTTNTIESGLPLPLTTPPEEPQKTTPQEETLTQGDYPIDRPVDVGALSCEQSSPRPQSSKPVGRQVWHRMTRTVTSFIGAGVSTTRSVIVLAEALLTLALGSLAGCLGLIVVAWLVLEEQPVPAYRIMTTEPQHTLGDSQKNGYFILLGFGAAPAQDPVQAGMDRRVEEADRATTVTCLSGEGQGSGGQGAPGEVVGRWLKTADPAAQMRAESAGVKSWVSQAGVGMGRYRQWLSKPFDDRGFGLPISPNCGVILYAHRLYVAEGFAQDVEAGIARLEADLTAWRTVFGQAKTMPVKMMAGNALNDDIAVVSGLLLRPDLDDRVISRLAKLARPFEPGEQSIRWPMQSEFVLATKTLGEALKHDPTDTRPFYGSIAAALPLPKQRRFNAYAQYYDAAGKAAGEGRYADLPKLSHFMHTPPYGVADVFVNPIESLVGIEPLPTWEVFAGRVLETDARLRLASLQAWLRRTAPEQDLLTRVAKAGQGLYDPFTGYPMLVNMKKGVFYSVGRDMKDNEAEGRFDIVAQIPPTALAAAKPTATVSSR